MAIQNAQYLKEEEEEEEEEEEISVGGTRKLCALFAQKKGKEGGKEGVKEGARTISLMGDTVRKYEPTNKGIVVKFTCLLWTQRAEEPMLQPP